MEKLSFSELKTDLGLFAGSAYQPENTVFASSTSKVIMLQCNRYSRVQEYLFISKQSPIRKLESCESSFV